MTCHYVMNMLLFITPLVKRNNNNNLYFHSSIDILASVQTVSTSNGHLANVFAEDFANIKFLNVYTCIIEVNVIFSYRLVSTSGKVLINNRF